MHLGVNIDHIAVLREARKINDPSPLDALGVCKIAGADQITIHLREDRRHINDEDAHAIIGLSPLPVNLECSLDEGIIKIVKELRPHRATLVPENREEVTTEGGLNLASNPERIEAVIADLKAHDISVSLFVDPEIEAMVHAAELGADMVELHTGRYANIYAMLFSNLRYSSHTIPELDLPRDQLEVMLAKELDRLDHAAIQAQELQLLVAAGHGLNYQNVTPITQIPQIMELNIGQSIVARSVFTGLERAVKEMKALLP